MKTDDDNSKEEVILKTAEKLFLKNGFTGTSTTDIAKMVGCNQALIHYYFRTKEKLFSTIFEKKMRLVITGFLEKDVKNQTFNERICSFIETHFNLLSENPQMPFFIINELSSNPKRLKSVKEQLKDIPIPLFEGFKRDLQAEIDAGRVYPMNIVDLLITVISLNMSIFLTAPIISEVFSLDSKQLIIMQKQRLKEHCRVVLAALRPELEEVK